MKVGGCLRISVPDWDATIQYYQRYKDLENITNWLYGGREEEVLNEFSHRRIFNFQNLKSLLYEAGFKRISKFDPRKTNHSDVDDFSFAVMPFKDFDNGIWMSLNVECGV